MSEQSYMKLPYDLSGAMAKNRFKNELLWGIHKILEVYTDEKKFNMILLSLDLIISYPTNVTYISIYFL